MTVRVRFDSGLWLQYNDCNFLDRHQGGYTDLRNKEGGDLLAQVPNSVLSGAELIGWFDKCLAAADAQLGREIHESMEKNWPLVEKSAVPVPEFKP